MTSHKFDPELALLSLAKIDFFLAPSFILSVTKAGLQCVLQVKSR